MRVVTRLSIGAALALACCAIAGAETPEKTEPDPAAFQALGVRDLGNGQLVAEFLSPTYTIDRVYRSMMGPRNKQRIALLDGASQEWLWITGYQAVIVGPDGHTPMPQEFMCHAGLSFATKQPRPALTPTPGAVANHAANFGFSPLFVLSQGQFDIQFPDGFGIPIQSNEPLDLRTQVLNLNAQPDTVQVRHKVSVYFRRQRELHGRTITPLFDSFAFGLVLLDGPSGGDYSVESSDESEHGPDCLPNMQASDQVLRDAQGRTFTGHWVVRPGRQENRTRVTRLMNVPFDTTLHYAAVHLHPFAESIELRDLTADRTLFMSRARGLSDRIGLDHVDSFSSAEGLPIFANHEYELVTVYNNTTATDQDSMAVMHLYLRDKAIEARWKAAREATPPSISESRQPNARADAGLPQ